MLIRENNKLKVSAQTYQLTFDTERPFVYLDDVNNNRIAELVVLSSIHPINGRDDTTQFEDWQVQEVGDEVILTQKASSSVWESKTYRFRCWPQRFSYDMEVTGKGQLAEVNYFGGYCSAHESWGAGFFWSKHNFKQAFTPEPNTDERTFFPASGSETIDMTGSYVAGRGDWFFTPPPFCYAFETPSGWLSMGVEAAPGKNRFSEYIYRAQRGFHLSLSYDGQTDVNGTYCLPTIGFDFAPDPYAALEAHVQSLRAQLFVPDVNREKSNWWYEPIFCGWGAQCNFGREQQQLSADFARQDVYEEFMHILDEKQLDPGIITIDWKWQKDFSDYWADPDKWLDLKSFIDGQHMRGRKVLLWMKAWDTEGIPLAECITNAAGNAVTSDSTNPLFQERLRNAVHRMLSPDGYNADGFKIDFTAQMASGPGLKKHGDAWGLELMRSYLETIYAEAKRTKPDSLVVTHTPHPYLADVLDMVRLNDVVVSPDINAAMSHRARVARIACPDALIDTDNWPFPDKSTWRAYVKLQPELGVPALYSITHIDRTGEALEVEDYDLIRAVWVQHRHNQL